MPVDIGGTTYYAFKAFPVEAQGSDDRLLGTTITVRDVSGNVLTPLNPVTQDAIADFTSSAVNGLSPSCLLPELVVTYDAGIGIPQVVESVDVAGLAQDAADAKTEAAAAKVAAETAQASAAAALAQVEAYIAAGGGGGTGTGTGLTTEQAATLAALDVTGGQDGDTLLLSTETGQFSPGPLPTPTVSADDILSGTLSHARLPEGVLVVVDKARAQLGAAAGAWPTVDPTGNPLLVRVWFGDQTGTDGPGTVMLAGDFRWYDEPTA